MRRIDTSDYRRATRGTSREINRQIVLSLIRHFQPISRAELARRMVVGRNAVARVVDGLVASGVVSEAPELRRSGGGRPPTLLTIRALRRVLAVDARRFDTVIALADLDGVA